MTFIEVFLIGIGLSMDAFAVAVCKGLGMRRVDMRYTVILALFFGGFQAGMPLIGWALGSNFAKFVEPVSHWVAFVLLAGIGTKMLWDAFHEEADEGGEGGLRIAVGEFAALAVATSIDAFAVGVSFAFLNVEILPSISIIGCTTFVLSLVGVWLGSQFGSRWERPSQIFGGIVLILLGVKILVEHLAFFV